MKKRVRKLIMLSASTVMAAASLVTTTYAWFKINATAKVENFDFEVVSGLGFEVSIDGKHYYGDLNMLQMQKAIVASYDPSMYKILPYDENGDKPDTLYKYVDSQFKPLSDMEAENEIKDVFKKIKLLPLTTPNGRDFKDLEGSQSHNSEGRFMEFGVYFKATSDNPRDKLKYDVYLNGDNNKDEIGNQMVGTIFTSKTTDVELSAGMNAVYTDPDGNKSIISRGPSQEGKLKQITVYSSNAARISTTVSNLTHFDAKHFVTSDATYDATKTYYTYDIQTDVYQEFEGDEFQENVTYYEFMDAYDAYIADENSSLIYEINDTEHPNTDLGSYATNYSDISDMDKYYLYNCDCNAMYTYYNNLRAEGRGLLERELDYEKLPQNIIRTLPADTKSSDIKKASSPSEASESSYYPIVTLESGADAKLVTFRVWLEGWDADCFDGLSNSIDMRLAFSSKRVY